MPHGSNWWSHPTPEQQRVQVKVLAAVTAAGTLAYWIGLFVTCRPALELFCFGPVMPWVFTFLWGMLAYAFGTLPADRVHEPHVRKRLWQAACFASLFLSVYSLIRADNDMFTLAVRQRIAAAGGAEQLRREWTEMRPTLPPDSELHPRGTSMPLHTVPPGGGAVTRKPKRAVPPGLYQMQVSMGTTVRSGNSDGTLLFTGIVFPNDFQVEVVPLDAEVGPPPDLWQRISGGRREIYDGIWIDVEIYNK